jgi:hypothetical protein
VEPLTAAVAGLLAAATYVCALLVLRIVLRGVISVSDPRANFFRIAFFHWQVALGLLLAVTAAVAAATLAQHRHQRMPVLHGLLAAIVAATPMSLIIVGMSSIAACIHPFAVVTGGRCPGLIETSFVWQQTRRLVNLAAVTAVPASAVSAGLVLLRSRHQMAS